MENPKTQNKKESKQKSNLTLSSKKTQYKIIFHIQIFKKWRKIYRSRSTNRSVAKKHRIARHGGSSSEYWKPGIHINNIPYYRQQLQCSSNPRYTLHQNRQWLQKADQKPHRFVLPLLLLRGDLVSVTAVVVVVSSSV